MRAGHSTSPRAGGSSGSDVLWPARCPRRQDMSAPVSAPHAVPFLDVVDPKFDFGSPEVAQAQATSWYANTPRGMLVLRYTEAQDLLHDPRLDHNGKRYLEANGIVDGPI